ECLFMQNNNISMDEEKTVAILRDLELFSIIKRLKLTDIPQKEEETCEENEKTYELKPPTAENYNKILSRSLFYFLPAFKDEEIVGLTLLGDFLVRLTPEADCFYEVVSKLNDMAENAVTAETKDWYRFLYRKGITPKLCKFDVSLALYITAPSMKSYTSKDIAEALGFPNITDETSACSLLPKIYKILKAKTEENKQEELLFQMEQPLSRVLASMEVLGFCLDTVGLNQYKEELDEDLIQLQQRIFFLAGEEFNLNSPKQLGEVLFEHLGLPAKKKTKTGYSTDVDVLQDLKKYHPVIEEILIYRSLSKLKSTYVDGLLQKVSPDGRLHSIFKQTETRTGRISSAEPNLQNIPVKTERGSLLRKFFVAREGCLLVDADYSQIELRVLAHIADDENMKQAFLNDVDIHTQTASQVFDMPPDFVTPQMRKAAKAVNFGIVYGIGAYSLSQDIGVTVKEADKYIKNYLATYGGVKKYMDEIIIFARENGYVKTLFGRRRPIPEIAASNKITQAFGERVAMNTPIQGTAADIIKLAMIKVFDRLEKEKLKARLILQVHDELIVETPADEVQKIKEILSEEMENAVSLSVRLKAEAKEGKNWLEAK
ncbi:MAG: DNA polymerase I, partial [Oscillospiraceae bacterium]